AFMLIYAAKGRPSYNPFIVHISEVSDIEKLAEDIPRIAYALADRFWPGPMTMILKKKDIVPMQTTGGLSTVAIRLPSDEIARMLINTSGVFVAAPSANASGRPSPTTAGHVIEDLSGRIDMIIDGGACDIGLESSIIDLSGDEPMILRPGFITKEDFEEVVNSVSYDKAVISKKMDKNIVAKAPGMKYRHYAPKGSITIVEGTVDRVADFINKKTEESESEGHKTAVLAVEENIALYHCKNIYSLGRKGDGEEIARNLFAALRELDENGMEVIYSESFDELKLSEAIMNRLRKAAGYNIINTEEQL
ncbi:MAG: threonylcarbamoyl-AMP synthase, partial [Lachnospiraceae bacterium]|nr:threonylcarbamoyl-AMP synthase [Lachnospiraceae bacterium]